jgi:DNA-binding GntR family transcriptional regulator
MINETQCARLAAERADSTDIANLEEVMNRARQAIGKRDVHTMMTLDREFHVALAAASKNFVLADLLRKLNERALRFWFISFTTPDHHSNFQEQHEAVLDAIRKHDPDAAEKAMRVHIESFRKNVAHHL